MKIRLLISAFIVLTSSFAGAAPLDGIWLVKEIKTLNKDQTWTSTHYEDPLMTIDFDLNKQEAKLMSQTSRLIDLQEDTHPEALGNLSSGSYKLGTVKRSFDPEGHFISEEPCQVQVYYEVKSENETILKFASSISPENEGEEKITSWYHLKR